MLTRQGRAEVFQQYVDSMPDTAVEGAIYKGMLLVHTGQLKYADVC
jgi:hypothetical protein